MADQEGARKSGKFIAVNLAPDVCKTPVGNTVVPVPYQISADLSDSVALSPNVHFTGEPAFIHDKSQVTHVTGDEAGTAGGVKSGSHKSIVEPLQGSTTVYINNKPVVRHGDPCKMNNGNTIGRIIYQGPSGGAPNSEDANPPARPETVEEQQAAREKKGLWASLSEAVHTTLDVAGFIPGLGIAADLANAGIYAAEGNFVLAGISAVAAVPGIGDGIKAGAMAAKAGKHLVKEAAEEVAEKAVKEVAEEAAEKGAKKTAAEGAESAAKKKGKDGARIKGPKKMKRHDVKCFRAGDKIPKGKHGEFDRQLQRQQDGLNNMTVDEYLKGRDAYKRIGRGSGAAQAAARRNEQKRMAEQFREQYRRQGISAKKAKQLGNSKAMDIMKKLAALHEPDMVAGGKNVVGGFGDARVNKSIGAGWKSRVQELDKAAEKASKAGHGKTKMNVKLKRCK